MITFGYEIVHYRTSKPTYDVQYKRYNFVGIPRKKHPRYMINRHCYDCNYFYGVRI